MVTSSFGGGGGKTSIGATIRIGREIWCLPYAVFFLPFFIFLFHLTPLFSAFPSPVTAAALAWLAVSPVVEVAGCRSGSDTKPSDGHVGATVLTVCTMSWDHCKHSMVQSESCNYSYCCVRNSHHPHRYIVSLHYIVFHSALLALTPLERNSLHLT